VYTELKCEEPHAQHIGTAAIVANPAVTPNGPSVDCALAFVKIAWMLQDFWLNVAVWVEIRVDW
jgi:hypothetical protein